jgi:hypothetical protein
MNRTFLFCVLGIAACSASGTDANPQGGGGASGSDAGASRAPDEGGGATEPAADAAAGATVGSGQDASIANSPAVTVDASVSTSEAGPSASDASPPVVQADSAIATDTQTLIPDPSWTCGMPAGIPPVTGGTLVFKSTLTLGEVYDIGETQYGHRNLIEIKGGTLTGPKIQATFMDRGLDYQLTLSNGVLEDEQVNILKTSDGVPIYFRNCGTSPGGGVNVRVVPDFEAPSASAYAWLNTGHFVGTREFDAVAKTLTMEVYDVSNASAPSGSVRITDPPGVPNQTYDCKVASGTKGAVVYMESVGIADGSVTIGASKRGTRNIVPITGGTTSGRVTGTVLSGGADYQLSASTFNLDARYTIKANDDGELIIVRNCGPLGALVPVFEARVGGSYDWLNKNTWLSSDPGVGVNVVNLTIYNTQ